MIEASFGRWMAPESIPTRGIDAIAGHPCGYQLIARAMQAQDRIIASVGPESLPQGGFLSQARGPKKGARITYPAFNESRGSMASALQVNRMRNRFHVFSRIIPMATSRRCGR
jgi:hypothetical protein